MNERIKELVKQAGGHFSTHTLTSYPVQHRESIELWDKNIEKFAELIVRECANHCDLLLDHKISSEWSRGTHDCSRAIKKHFGVEE